MTDFGHGRYTILQPILQGASMCLAHTFLDSPVGRLRLVAGDRGLAAILWEKDAPHSNPWSGSTEDQNHPVLLEAQCQLREYFAGSRQSFSLPLEMRGTRFQTQVWEALQAIPFGETRSYGELAKQLGNPKATRAVGAANGGNPLPIVVPCHRVIGSTGKLTGFGGGLEVKARLLGLEANERKLFE